MKNKVKFEKRLGIISGTKVIDQTRFRLQTDRQTYGRQTDGQGDSSIPPLQTRLGGYKYIIPIQLFQD